MATKFPTDPPPEIIEKAAKLKCTFNPAHEVKCMAFTVASGSGIPVKSIYHVICIDCKKMGRPDFIASLEE